MDFSIGENISICAMATNAHHFRQTRKLILEAYGVHKDKCGLMFVCLMFYQLFFSFLTAKQKLEDRLAAAAREKLAQASKESKERQLQAERKRKAALFLQNLRGPEAEVKRQEETPSEVRASKVSKVQLHSLYFFHFFK